ncbi:hypothetical protein ILUMI_22012 [Ignelater luminosus]|uniref:CRAL-TRIO domain-containing protein n=1 Tax=Ignelater luminosus TaxID=2038154 RepID=A0A8K0CBD4_IGNLU|nr:hypothetical protein ILUMI_22012 [Ignelater luminosus]
MCANGIVDFSGEMLTSEDIKHRTRELLKLILGKTIFKYTECLRSKKILFLEHDKLKSFRKDEPFLLRFLHCSDFDVALALKKLQNFTDFIFKHPNWVGRTSPLHIKRKFEVYDKAMLKDRDRKGRAIFVIKLGKVDVANSSPQEQWQIIDMWFESILDNPIVQTNGVNIIIDTNAYSWRLFRWLTPTNMRIAVKKLDVCPIKEVLLHVVNTSFLINASIKLLWPFLNDRLKNMFKFHFDNWPSLHEYINPNVLPTEYGGDGPDIDFEESVQMLFNQDSSIRAKLICYQISNE